MFPLCASNGMMSLFSGLTSGRDHCVSVTRMDCALAARHTHETSPCAVGLLCPALFASSPSWNYTQYISTCGYYTMSGLCASLPRLSRFLLIAAACRNILHSESVRWAILCGRTQGRRSYDNLVGIGVDRPLSRRSSAVSWRAIEHYLLAALQVADSIDI